MIKAKTSAGIMTMKPVDRLLQIFFPGLIIGIFLVQTAPLLLDSAEQYYLRKRLDTDVNRFYTAVQAAYTTAMQTHQRIGVEVSSEGWVIYRDDGLAWQRDERDAIIARGTWNDDLRFGSTLPQHRFFVTAEGLCYIDQSTACLENERKISSFAFTSNARRIYTVDLAGNEPRLDYDDF